MCLQGYRQPRVTTFVGRRRRVPLAPRVLSRGIGLAALSHLRVTQPTEPTTENDGSWQLSGATPTGSSSERATIQDGTRWWQRSLASKTPGCSARQHYLLRGDEPQGGHQCTQLSERAAVACSPLASGSNVSTRQTYFLQMLKVRRITGLSLRARPDPKTHWVSG